MAESKPPTRRRTARSSTPPAEASKAQAEFARYKDRVAETGTGPGASFASPPAGAAIPAWSLQPAPPAPGPPGPGASPWGSGTPAGGGSAPIRQGVGTTIRLGVDVLNAALSSSLLMLSGVGGAVGWGHGTCGCGGDCDGGCDCCGGYDCCCAMGCGCGCCEPSVGTCC
jgi:hypothetical protein